MSISSKPSKRDRPTAEMGIWAEQLVAEWLMAQGWQILHRRWQCRWGELDLIALHTSSGSSSEILHREKTEPEKVILPPRTISPLGSGASCESSNLTGSTLAFVEVKARSRGNWDSDGLMAITAQKQAKLWQTAQVFLATFPELAEQNCRFDVALVQCQRRPTPSQGRSPLPDLTLPVTPLLLSTIHLGQSVEIPGYRLTLHSYLAGAFGL